MILCKLTSSILLIFLIYSCSTQNQQSKEEDKIVRESVDSSGLYSFFADKISPTWDFSPENDSVIFEFDKYKLPRRRSQTKLIGSESKHFSIEYFYNVIDSTETVRHLQQYGGGHSFTEIRKFDQNGNVLWKEEIDENHNHTRTEYDKHGMIVSVKALR